ncbi:hypothetical protein Rsub_00064 [Raphidocelis subcapitata]|uniref:Domain of unknown function at the cortex 1 domain-containing protein n=1 Tax=Raphidocelis subcapitata TaxID=307507 RepID=A0A2V0NPB0_9CHLO|nr:hypothetical protein Rsub_00064 [Raphidocelis subcapitata]|eukprot:GBF87353.1 hypothetical protein Rsub_00064 [Raphidocelis subcapitata]
MATLAGPQPAPPGGKAARPTVIAEALPADSPSPRQRDAHPEGFYGLGHNDVHPFHKPAQPSREAMRASPHYPVVVTKNPIVEGQRVDGTADPSVPIPINGGAVTIETEVFVGRLEVHLKGLPSTKKGMFEGKKRFFQIAVQGKFKREVAADAVCMGQEFVKESHAVPAWLSELLFTAASKVFSNSAHVDVYAPLPYFMNPMLAACQTANACRDEDAQEDMWAVQEDMRLVAPGLADKSGAPLSSDKRRKWCDNPKNLEGCKFVPGLTYTLHIWQHLIDFSSYKLNLGGILNLDLAHALAAQPLQLTCKDIKSDVYLFSALVWHERLIYPDEPQPAEASKLAERFAKLWPGSRRQ